MVTTTDTTAAGPFTADNFPGASNSDLRVLNTAFDRLRAMRPDLSPRLTATVVSWAFGAFCAAERSMLDDLDEPLLRD